MKSTAVEYNGETKYYLNSMLLYRQNAWPRLEELKELHSLKLLMYELIEESTDRLFIRSIAKDIEQIEYKLQEVWGFDIDSKYHIFWEYPKCTCPKLDNRDRYPNGYYIIDVHCPLHGIF